MQMLEDQNVVLIFVYVKKNNLRKYYTDFLFFHNGLLKIIRGLSVEKRYSII